MACSLWLSKKRKHVLLVGTKRYKTRWLGIHIGAEEGQLHGQAVDQDILSLFMFTHLNRCLKHVRLKDGSNCYDCKYGTTVCVCVGGGLGQSCCQTQRRGTGIQ